jgi:hypothetical protein
VWFRRTNRLAEAEPLMRRGVEILLGFARSTGHQHPHLEGALSDYVALLSAMGYSEAEVGATLKALTGGE